MPALPSAAADCEGAGRHDVLERRSRGPTGAGDEAGRPQQAARLAALAEHGYAIPLQRSSDPGGRQSVAGPDGGTVSPIDGPGFPSGFKPYRWQTKDEEPAGTYTINRMV